MIDWRLNRILRLEKLLETSEGRVRANEYKIKVPAQESASLVYTILAALAEAGKDTVRQGHYQGLAVDPVARSFHQWQQFSLTPMLVERERLYDADARLQALECFEQNVAPQNQPITNLARLVDIEFVAVGTRAESGQGYASDARRNFE